MTPINFIIISISFFFVSTSCTTKNQKFNDAISNLQVSFSDSLFFETNNSTIDSPQSLVLWYWSDSSIMFNIRPDSLNIHGQSPWMAEDATPEIGLTSISYNGIDYDAIEYITYSNGFKLGVRLNITDTSLATVKIISDSINVLPDTNVMVRKK